MHPRCVIADFLACHEKRILLQPPPALLAKGIEGTTVVLSSVRKESRSGFVQERLFEGNHLIVGYLVVRKIWRIVQVQGRQKALFTKLQQICEQRVPGKRREALIRRIAVSCGVQWQHLPNLLP